MAADIGTLTPEQMLQQQQILRQQKMAEMLMQKGMEQPQGQMISGHYVAPSIFQNLAGLANTYVGQRGIEKGEQAQLDLAKAIREQKMGVLENINQALDAGDLKKARSIATANPEFAGQFAAPLIANAIPKTPDAVAKFKFAQTPEGGNFKGTLADFENQMTPYQKQSLALQAAGQNKPQIIETANGYVAVNPSNPNQAIPVMFNGQQVMGNKGNLPEGPAGQVTGVQNVKSALTDLKTNLKDFNTFDMVNPNKRALIATDYQNAILQLKEAMKLGVLNGNDYTILTSMITDPNSPKALLIDKKTQMQQINNLESKLDQMTSNVYKTHQKSVPSNLLTPAAPVKKGGIPTGVTQAEWNAMSPADRKLFE